MQRAGILLLGLGVLTATGCMPSEKASFQRHLGTIIEPLEEPVALGVRSDLPATQVEAVSVALPLSPDA